MSLYYFRVRDTALSVNIETLLQWLDIKVLLIYALEIDAFGKHGDHLEY